MKFFAITGDEIQIGNGSRVFHQQKGCGTVIAVGPKQNQCVINFDDAKDKNVICDGENLMAYLSGPRVR